MRIFLDANILFSASKSDGAVRHLLRLLLEAGHECWVDDYVVIEARRNLVAKGAGALTVFEALLVHLRVSPVQTHASAQKEVGWLPEKDRPVLAAAMHLRCDALVTGDRTHFGVGYGKAFGGVTIHSPRSLAEALLI
jgi:predicted nucleic acid-binding protein